MDKTLIRQPVLYTNTNVSREFATTVIANLAEKNIEVSELFYGNSEQIPIVEEALNSWRDVKGTFTWPFIVYKITEENGEEGARFVQGEQSINEFVSSLT